MTLILNRNMDPNEFEELSPRPKDVLYQENKVASAGGSPGALAKAIFIDGEGINRASDGKQIYVYLSAWTDGAPICEPLLAKDWNDPYSEGLKTEEIFWFLVNLPQSYRLVGFGLGYDVNMWLKNLAKWDGKEDNLTHIFKSDWRSWKGWRMQFIPGKEFYVRRDSEKYGIKKAHIWDNFGFFQMSFVKAMDLWKVGTEAERELVRKMKLTRNEFVAENLQEIIKYCDLECKLGAQAFNKLTEQTRSLGLKLRRYDGAGAIASAMFTKHNVQQYMNQGTNGLPRDVICGGYFGGRFDLSTFGECGNAFEYDINSAYPYIALSLPCLSCSQWEYTSNYDGNVPWAIWNVKWDLDKSALWSPFPYRYPGNHGIKWVRNGQGWYWSNELREAVALYPDAIQIRGGYVLHQACNHRPFSFIAKYYDERQRLKAKLDLGEQVLKLGLNANYGKLAQGVGHKDTPPKTQCLIWAGMITAGTRGMLLRAIREDPEDVILIATDAIFKRHPATTLDISKTELGKWKPTEVNDLFILTNGFYTGTGLDLDVIKNATRGFSARDIIDPDNNIDHWAQIRELAQESDRFEYTVPVRHFYGAGECLGHNPKLDKWLTWTDKPERLTYGKFKNKEARPGRQLYPLENKYPDDMSTPHNPDLYREDGVRILPWDIYQDIYNASKGD